MTSFDLGPYARPITTASKAAKAEFDQGLKWMFCFNHGEAIACFQRALAHDPDCAMAHWGVAYAAGPNYNLPWHLYDPKGKQMALETAYDAMQEALKRTAGLTEIETALIRALPHRYPQREAIKDQSDWDKAFTAEMRKVFERFPGDLEVRTVFAEAIMNETPWKMWNVQTGEVAEDAKTAEAIAVLEEAFDTIPEAWQHPGLLHLYVHLMEMSPFPERALRVGDALREISPEAGHLIHMPTHIDVLCGNYRDVLVYNKRALAVDRKFLDYAENPGVYLLYVMHNFHFAVYGAMFLGQYEEALAHAQELIERVPEEVLRVESPPMADFLEAHLTHKQHVMVRFGKWKEIIAQELPVDQELYCSVTAMTLYAQSVAHSALGHIAEAEAKKAEFLAAKARMPESRRVHNNTVVDLLAVAESMLDGELEYRKGNYEVAYAHLRRAVALDDALPYDEPWGWMQPARHALGALLMEQGHYEEAEGVYRADLGLDDTLARPCQHPGNVWSLHGLHQCLARRGETVEARHIKLLLDQAMARATVPIRASCFCSQAAMAAE